MERIGGAYYEITAENNVTPGLTAAEAEVAAAKQGMSKDVEFDVKANVSNLKRVYKQAQSAEKAHLAEMAKLRSRWQAGELRSQARYEGRMKKLSSEADRLKSIRLRAGAEKDAAEAELSHIREIERAEVQHAKAIADTEKAHSAQRLEVTKLRHEYVKLGLQIKKVEKRHRLGSTAAEKEEIAFLRAKQAQAASALRVADRDTDFDRLDHAVDHNRRTLTRWASEIGQTRVHLGILSLSLRGLAIGLTTFAPIIFGVLGAASSLIGVLGTGLTGALAAGTAAAAGFGLSALGIGIAIRPQIEALNNAVKAGDSYADAVQKYGKGSEQAQDKLDQYKNSIKGLPPESRKAVQAFTEMRGEWQKQTEALREPFFQTATQGLKTATALLPIFSKQTVATGKVVARETQNWFKALRSPEAQGILTDVMANFRQGLPALFDGLGSLAAMFGRIAQAASTFLPELNKGFAQWAQNLEESVGGGDQLENRLGRLINHMQDLGHLAQAAGKVLVTFFSTAADEGDGMVKSMTGALNRWNQWMKSVEGQESLGSFFEHSADLMRQLIPAILNLGATLAAVSTSLEPLIEGFSKILNLGLRIAAMVPAGFLQLAGGLAAAGYMMKKLTSFAGLASLGFLKFGRGAAVAEGAAAGAGAAAAGGAGAAGEAGAAFGAAGVAARGLGLRLLPLVGTAFTIGEAGQFVAEKWSGAAGTIRNVDGAIKQFTRGARAAYPAAVQAGQSGRTMAEQFTSRNAAWAKLNQLIHEGKRGTQQYDAALKAATAAENSYQQTRQKHASAIQELTKAENDLETAGRAVDQAQTNLTQADWVNAPEEAMKSWQNYQKAVEHLDTAQKTYALNAVNVARGIQGLPAITKKANEAFVTLRETLGKKITAKIGLIEDPRIAAKVARLSGDLAKLGRGQQVRLAFQAAGDDPQRLARLLQGIRNKTVKLTVKDDGSVVVRKVKGNLDSLPKQILSKLLAFDAVSPVLTAVLNSLKGFNGQTFTAFLNVVRTVTGHATGGPGVGAIQWPFAQGGVADRRQWEAQRAAERRVMIDSKRGARVTEPTYVTGEERRPEWIIAENPAYRAANEGYLEDAARALGFLLVPAFARGGGPKAGAAKKKNKKGGGNSISFWEGLYNKTHDDLETWEREYDLDQRAFDLGVAGGLIGNAIPGITDLQGDKSAQITQLMALQNIIPALLKENAEIQARPTPKVKQKKTKTKHQKKKKKRQEAARDKVENMKADAADAADGLDDELKQIPYDIANLQLDIIEIGRTEGGMATQMQAFNAARYEAFKAYSSNVMSGGAGVPGGPTGPNLTPPTSGFAVPSSAGAQTRDAAASLALPGTKDPSLAGGRAFADARRSASGKTINVTNNYKTTPKDPHTWSQDVAFELQAL